MRGLRKNRSSLVILTAFLLLVSVLSFRVRSLADGEEPHVHTWQDGVCTECNYECDHSGNTRNILCNTDMIPSTCSSQGQWSYMQRCSVCHTIRTKIPIDPYAHTWTLTSGEVFNDCKGGILDYKCEECGTTMFVLTQPYAHRFAWNEEVGAMVCVNENCDYQMPEGDGTKDSPYQLFDGVDLYWFADWVNEGHADACAVLMDDIDFEPIGLLKSDGLPWSLEAVFKWIPIGSATEHPFCGSFDGQGHSIKGFVCIDTENSYDGVGLFGVVGNNAEIKNVSVLDSFFYGYGHPTGSIVGYFWGNLEDIQNDPDQTGVRIQNCSSDSTVMAYGYVGGIVGSLGGGNANDPRVNSIEGCIFSGHAIAKDSDDAAGIVGTSGYTDSVSHCANIGYVSYYPSGFNAYQYSDNHGAIICDGARGTGDHTAVSYCGCLHYTSQGTDSVQLTTEQVENGTMCSLVGMHSFKGDTCSYCGAQKGAPLGDGTKANPYQLSNADQLYWFASQVNDEGRNTICAILTDDLVVNDKVLKDHKPVSSNLRKWTPIGWNADTADHVNYPNTYAGTFDGNGHTIWGLYCNEPDMDYVGLFGIVTEGVIKNLSVKDSYFRGFDYVGGIVGAINPDTYSECAGVVRECYFNGTVEGRSNLGGICGMLNGARNRYDRRDQGLEYDDSLIAYCYVSGRVKGLEGDDSIWIGAVVGLWYSGEILYNHYEGGVAVDGNNMTQCGRGTNWKGHVEEDDPDMTRRVLSSWADSHLFCTNCTLHGDLSTYNDPNSANRLCDHCHQPMPVAKYTVAVYSRTDTSSASMADVSVGGVSPYYLDEPVTVTAPDLTTEGYSFLGWYEVFEDDGSNVTQYGERFSTALEYTFKIHQDSKCVAVYHAMGNGKVTIHTINGAKFYVSSDPGTLNNSLAAEFPLGTVLTIQAADAEEVLQWQNENDKLLGRGDSLTITVTGNMTISLVYKTVENGQSFVQFVSDYGQVLSYQQYSSSSNVTMPPVPSKMGFTGIGWLFEDGTEADAETIKARIGAVDLITLKPKYEASNEKGTLKIQYYTENAPIAGVDEVTYANLPYGTGKSVTAPEISSYKFSHWAKADGTPLGYQKDYYVLINSADVTIRACYVAEGEVTIAQPVITISELSAINDNGILKLRATVTRSIPDGYTLIEHGVLYARDFASPSEENFTYEASNTESSGVSRYISDTTSMSGAVTLNMKVADGEVKCTQRGYMVLKNNTTGNYEYHYSELKTGSYNEINQ